MKKVYSSDNVIQAGHVLSLLQASNIACHARNMSLAGGIGDLPMTECWPEIWINDERDYKLATDLINHALSLRKAAADWRCQCGELIEGQFETCWACGKEYIDRCQT